jgi:nucleotide-binding universal stress UspA family protein
MDSGIRTIVVGVSEMHRDDPKLAPPGEDPVLGPAIALADRLGAHLHVVKVFARANGVLGAYKHALQNEASARQQRAEVERGLWAQVRRFPNIGRVRCHALEGRADIQLCAFAEEVGADLLMVGATRRGRLWQNMLGSTAERVIQRASVPVLVVRRPFDRPVRRVLLTTDLSDLGPAHYEIGMDLVERVFGDEPLDVRSLLVCWYDSETAARVSRALMRNAAEARLEAFLEEREGRRHPVSPRVRIGNPSTEILHEIGEWKADLVVVGTHGRWGASPWLLGSTAGATLRGSSCNALVIPTMYAASSRRGRRAEHREAVLAFPGTEEHSETGVLSMR